MPPPAPFADVAPLVDVPSPGEDGDAVPGAVADVREPPAVAVPDPEDGSAPRVPGPEDAGCNAPTSPGCDVPGPWEREGEPPDPARRGRSPGRAGDPPDLGLLRLVDVGLDSAAVALPLPYLSPLRPAAGDALPEEIMGRALVDESATTRAMSANATARTPHARGLPLELRTGSGLRNSRARLHGCPRAGAAARDPQAVDDGPPSTGRKSTGYLQLPLGARSRLRVAPEARASPPNGRVREAALDEGSAHPVSASAARLRPSLRYRRERPVSCASSPME